MRNKLLWVAGLAKTGNSARHDFLRWNKKAFADAGIGIAYGSLISSCETLMPGDGALAIKKLFEQNFQTVLIQDHSMYHLMCKDISMFDEIIDFIGSPEVNILIYLRRQDTWMESMYREMIRSTLSATIPFEKKAIEHHYGEASLFDYNTLLTNLEKRYEKVTPRVFHKKFLKDGDLFVDFCDAIGVTWRSSFRLPTKKINRAPDSRLSNFLIETNRVYSQDCHRSRRAKEILEELGRIYFVEAEDSIFEPEDRADFLKQFAEGNKNIAKKYGIGDLRTLFPLDDLRDQKPKKNLTVNDAVMLQMYTNQAWVNCLGAVPFSVYNQKKIEYLERKISHVSTMRQLVATLQIWFHKSLQMLRRAIPIKKWSDDQADEIAMTYIMKNMKLYLGNDTDFFGKEK